MASSRTTDTGGALQTLDGPALTAQAFRLGLAPAGVTRWTGGFTLTPPLFGAWTWTAATIPWWAPHADLPQALAILHRLEGAGWHTRRAWYAQEDRGFYTLWRGPHHVRSDWGLGSADATEALACLRGCVQAVTQMRESPSPGRAQEEA